MADTPFYERLLTAEPGGHVVSHGSLRPECDFSSRPVQALAQSETVDQVRYLWSTAPCSQWQDDRAPGNCSVYNAGQRGEGLPAPPFILSVGAVDVAAAA